MAVKNARTTVGINGPALRFIRVLSGVGVRELAGRIGRDRSYIAHIELGRVQRVSPAVFNALLLALEIEDRRVLSASPHVQEKASA